MCISSGHFSMIAYPTYTPLVLPLLDLAVHLLFNQMLRVPFCGSEHLSLHSAEETDKASFI